MKKIFIKHHKFGAGVPIYKGYGSAWDQFGYEVNWFDTLGNVPKGSLIMAIEDDLRIVQDYKAIKNSLHSFIFVKATDFPEPYCFHPNFVSNKSSKHRQLLNALPNVTLWSFSKPDQRYFSGWGDNVLYLPLAHDSINYSLDQQSSTTIFDICYVGGRADNGFDTKYNRMKAYFEPLFKSGLRCGIFIEKNISHEDENRYLLNSKISVNIHDSYQIELGLDINERIFKGLYLTDCVISDRVDAGVELLGDRVEWVNNPAEMVETALDIAGKVGGNGGNREFMLENHTYLKRVEKLLEEL